MKFRAHRGGLDESLKTTVELANLDELVAHLTRIFKDSPIEPVDLFPINPGNIQFKRLGYDYRTGWDTHLVVIPDFGVVGFSDGKP